jgi:hypothetical protein
MCEMPIYDLRVFTQLMVCRKEKSKLNDVQHQTTRPHERVTISVHADVVHLRGAIRPEALPQHVTTSLSFPEEIQDYRQIHDTHLSAEVESRRHLAKYDASAISHAPATIT